MQSFPSKAPYISFNSAGSALMAEPVVQAQITFIRDEQVLGGYYCAERYEAEFAALYDNIASLLSISASQVALQESASRAMQTALLSIPWRQSDHVLVSRREYGAHVMALQQLQQRYGLEIEIYDDHAGLVDETLFNQLIRDDTKAVLATWIGSHNGEILDVPRIGELIENHQAYFIIDGCQVCGQQELDLSAFRWDFFTATGRKFLRAPRGTGFLAVSNRVLEAELIPMVTDHSATAFLCDSRVKLNPTARRFELWEANMSARYGLKVALDALLSNEFGIYQSIENNQKKMLTLLKQFPNLKVFERGDRRSAIITFTHQSKSAKEVYKTLRSSFIDSSVVTADAGWLDLGDRPEQTFNRLSVHSYNIDSDFERLATVLSNV